MYLFLLFVFAFILRLVNLNQSLWLDEAIVAKVVRTIPFHLIPIQFSPGDFHPPLYYMVISLWTQIAGHSEIALRFPSILFSLVAGWYVYKIGCEIKDKTVGLWAAAFFLFNPLIIYYSQEARMYMMATALLSIALYYFVVMMKELKISNLQFKNVLFFNLFSALAMLTFYGSAFFIAGMIVSYFLIVPKGRDLRKRGFWIRFFYLSIGLFVALAILSPLLYQQIMNARVNLLAVKNWSLVLGKAEIKNAVMIFLKFATGRVSWYPKISYYLLAGSGSFVVGIFVLLGVRRSKLLAVLFILPLLFGLFVSFWAPMMMYFRFLYLIPVMSILLTFSVSSSKPRELNGRVERSYNDIKNILILVIFMAFSLLYLLNPQFHREDWKNLSQALMSQTPVYMILPSSDPISYYRDDILVFELRDIKKMNLPEHINVIPYTSEIYGLDYVDMLQAVGCMKEMQSSFRGGLVIEKWKCLRNA